MRIGVLLMPTDPWQRTVDTVRRLEARGFDHLWVYDHVNWRRYRDRPWFAAVPWLTGVACVTNSIRLGTLVANPNLRHPLTFAKDVLTLDHVAAGRLTVGVGAGGVGYDATVLGREVLTPPQRVDRLAEFLELLDGLLTGTIESYHGTHYSVDDVRVLPKCVQQPRAPIAVAAGGRRTLSLVARYADAWVTWGDTTLEDLSPEGTLHSVRRQSEILEQHCVALGRDVADIDRIFLIGNTEDRPLSSLGAFLAYAERYSALGITDLVFHHPRPDDPVWTEDPAVVDHIADRLADLHAM